MVDAKFSPEMKDIIKSMKGKTFKSFEGVPENQGIPIEFYGNFRINLGRESVVFTNLEQVTQFPGSVEDVSCFKCVRVDKDDDFTPYLAGPHLVYMVNERIKSIAVVTDTISVDEGDYVIEFDMALIIRTPYNVYTFTRDWYYGETIDLFIDPKEAKPFDIQEELKQWKDIQTNVEIVRKIEEL